MQNAENGHCNGKTGEKRYEHRNTVGSGGIHARDQKENGRKTDADLNGRRNIEPEFLLDKYGQTHQHNFKYCKYGKPDQCKERAFFPKEINGGCGCKGKQQETRTD